MFPSDALAARRTAVYFVRTRHPGSRIARSPIRKSYIYVYRRILFAKLSARERKISDGTTHASSA